MKLLNENQIYDISMSRGQAVCPISFAKGMEETQKLLLESASEDFEGYFNNPRIWTEGRMEVAREAWQACELSHAKKMQEKDAEIESLKRDFRKIFYAQDNLALEEIEDIEVKWLFKREENKE